MVQLDGFRLGFVAGTLGQGGAERQLFYILRALTRSGAAVRLFTLTTGEYWEDRIRALGVDVVWVGRAASKLARSAAVVREARRRPLDLIQSQHFFTNLYAVAAARATGVREIGALRSDAVAEVEANGRVLGPLSLRVPRILAANSRLAMRNAGALGVAERRLHLLPNVVDVDRFRPGNGATSTNTIRLLSAGRLVAAKRHDRFLRLLAALSSEGHRDVRGVIVGDGPLRASLEAEAERLGLLPNIVEFRGAESAMEGVYREADALVMTSDYEGTPNVVLEAMASGLPVVAPRVGGIPDIVEDGSTGLLFDRDDERALVECVAALVGTPDLRVRLGAAARASVTASHCPERLPSLLSDLYTAALA